jgi:hypothetical protein
MQSINDEQNRQHLSSIKSARQQASRALKILGKGFKAVIVNIEDDGSNTSNPNHTVGYAIYAASKQLSLCGKYDVCPDTGSRRAVLEIVTAEAGD